MENSKKEILTKLDQVNLSGQLYILGDFPTFYDSQIFTTIHEFDLANSFDAESHPNLFAWHCLLKMYTANVRISWPAPWTDEQKDP